MSSLYDCTSGELRMALQFKGLKTGRKDEMVERAAEAGFKDYDDVVRFLKEMHPWPVLPWNCVRHQYAETLEERQEMLRENGTRSLTLHCAKCGMLRKWTPSRPRKKAPSPKATVEDRDGPTGPCAPMFGLLF